MGDMYGPNTVDQDMLLLLANLKLSSGDDVCSV